MISLLRRVVFAASLLGAAAFAQEPAVVVNGKPLITAIPPAHIGGEQFLPLGPIARALAADITAGADQILRVRRGDGATLTYDGRTGEIRAGAVLTGQVKDYRLIRIAADPDRVLFPLTAIVPLLAVKVRLDDQANILYLDSDPNAGAPPAGGFAFSDLSYQYGLTTNGDIFGHNANLRGLALAGSTTLTGQVQATRVAYGPAVYLNQATMRAAFASGKAITLGDQGIYSGIDVLTNSVRGLGYEQKVAGFSTYLYGGEAIGSVTASLGGSVAHYDTQLVGFSFRRGSPTRFVSFGGNAFRNSQRRGASFGLAYGQRIARNQFNIQGTGGFFSGLSLHTVPLDQLKAEAGLLPTTVNGVPVPSDTATVAPSFEMTRFIQVHGPAYGVTASDAFLPITQISLSGQVDYYSKNFLTARDDTRFNGASAATVSLNVRPFKLLTLNGSAGNREFVLGDTRRTRSYTYGATFVFPGRHSPQIGATRTIQLDAASGIGRFELTQYSLLLPSWGRYSASVFYSETILGPTRLTDLNAIASVDTKHYGRFSAHFQSQFHANERYGADWYWKLGDKDGFLRIGVDRMRVFYSHTGGFLPLIGIRLPLPHNQVLEISYIRDISSQFLQFQLGGKLIRPQQILRDSRGVPRINARTTILGRVYVDSNHNGIFDDGDRGVADTEVWLDQGTVTRTDGQGVYRFDAIEPGGHSVRAEISGIPAGFVFAGSGQSTIAAIPNRENRADFRVIRTGHIEGRVTYLDYSADADNPKESPFPDARIVVTGDGDTYTEANGSFTLGDLPPGRYELRIDPATLPAGYVSQPVSTTVIVEPGAHPPVVRFKLVVPPKPVIEIKGPDQKINIPPAEKPAAKAPL
jgi:hypothetical protein